MELKDYYLALCQHISDLLPGLIRHQDLYEGQDIELIGQSRDELFDVPALFYEFDLQFTDTSQLAQQAMALLRCYLVQERIAATQQGSREQSRGLIKLELEQQVMAALHGFTTTGAGRLLRRAYRTVPSGSNVKVTVLEYQMNYADVSTAMNLGQVESGNDGTLTLGKQLVENIEKPPRVSGYKL